MRRGVVMKNINFLKINKAKIFAIAIFCLLAFVLIFVVEAFTTEIESFEPIPLPVTFQGEYKIGDGEWRAIKSGEHISATKDDVTLKGFFKLHDPETGEIIGNISKGTNLHFYLNHINLTVKSQNQPDVQYSSEMEQFGDAACGIVWQRYWHMTDAVTETVLLFHNPHFFGNESAIDDFLQNVTIYVDNHTIEKLNQEANGDTVVGVIIIGSAIVILSIAVFSKQIRMGFEKGFWYIGGVLLSAGVYFLFSPMVTVVTGIPLVVNTSIREISKMMYFFFVMCTLSLTIDGVTKKICQGLTVANGITIFACAVVGMLPNMKFYDVVFYWAIMTVLELVVFCVCVLLNFKKTSLVRGLASVSVVLITLALILDLFALGFGWWEEKASQIVFILLFLVVLTTALRVILKNAKESYRARELELERQSLQVELEERKIAIMLSQIQPHFLYNTLNTIYHLCDVDVDKAKTAIDSFADYLRNNINSLNENHTIGFETEIKHVNTYLNLEKIRFGEELEIEYDLQATSFQVPVLSVQPIVENAVKHGTSKKRGGGKVTICSFERDDDYVITVTDTGVGFDYDPNNIEGDSIGIKNVTQRLKNTCGGTLNIESKRGEGTKATITIPKIQE